MPGMARDMIRTDVRYGDPEPALGVIVTDCEGWLWAHVPKGWILLGAPTKRTCAWSFVQTCLGSRDHLNAPDALASIPRRTTGPRRNNVDTTAKTIASDIRWIMQGNRLNGDDFKVKTTRVGDSFVTTIYNVDPERARQALALYASKPAVDLSTRDGFLTVTQPAS